MKPLVFSMHGQEALGNDVTGKMGAVAGNYIQRTFPDGETYTRILSDVNGRKIIVIAGLHHPDSKIMPLWFLCHTLRDLKAAEINLVVPYLPYMRQDMAFNDGEAIASTHFATMLSRICDRLVTIDPHLHRLNDLSAIFTVPCKVLHAAPLIAAHIEGQYIRPLLVGPDEESEQWVAGIAKATNNPYLVFKKKRYGDKEVRIDTGTMESYKDRFPLLIDDIISSGASMSESAKAIIAAGLEQPSCIVIHPVFSEQVYERLKSNGFYRIDSCNTIPHESNSINVAALLADYFMKELWPGDRRASGA